MKRWAFLKRYDIVGPDGSLYMRRWRLIQTPWFAVYLHKIVRPDADLDLHDHPWNFVSLILRGGYIEIEPDGAESGRMLIRSSVRRPFSIVRHRAEDLHRVSLFVDKLIPSGGCSYHTAWTLVFCGRRRREWGFQTEEGWKPWHEYLADR